MNSPLTQLLKLRSGAHRKKIQPASLLVFAACLIGPRLGAQAPAPASTEEPVVLSPFEVSSQEDTGYSVKQTVSGTRLATDLDQLPITVSVLTDQFIKDLGADDIQDALRYQNVTGTFTDFFTANISSSYILRGFTAATMRDGFVAAGGNTPTATIAVDRVEIVKGPESLLYGEMDPGGLVNIVSKRATSVASTSATAYVGSYDTRGATLDTDGRLTKDGRFNYRIMGDFTDGNAISRGTTNQRKEFVALFNGQLTPHTDINLEFDFVHNHVNAQPIGRWLLGGANTPQGTIEKILLPGEDGAPPAFYNYRGPGNYGDGLERYLHGELHHHFISGWDVRLSVADIFDGSGRINNKGPAPITTTNGAVATTYQVARDMHQGLQLDVTKTWDILGGNLQFLAGTMGEHANIYNATSTSTVTISAQPGYTGLNPANPTTWYNTYPSPPLSTFTNTTVRGGSMSEDGAVYTSDVLSIFQDRLHLLAGARENRATSFVSDYLNHAYVEYAENDASYQTGIMYQFTKSFGVYASWSESYNPQTVLITNPKPTDPATGLPVVGSVNTVSPALPVKGEGHDIGIKAGLLGGKLDLTAEFFDVRRSNEIQNRVTNNAAGVEVDTFSVQSGAEQSEGWEMGLVGRPIPSVDMTLTYTEPITSILLSDASAPAYVGKQINNDPKHQLSYFVKYTQQGGALKGMFLGLGGKYWSAFQNYQTTQTQIAEVQGYFLMDAVAGYKWGMGKGRYFTQLNATNLTNRHAILGLYQYVQGITLRFSTGVKF